ncbi:MAG: hypothetical protein RBR03_05235 [Desulfuromonas thiophila]|jgi:hypothetical protein|nr:hypothetical protein [Desulfuromonas thiophila]
MLGYLAIAGIAYFCSKYISLNWTGAIKLTFAHFASFLISWLLGGFLVLAITSIFAEIAKNAIPVFFARGFWWTLIGIVFGIYIGREEKKKKLSNTQQSGNFTTSAILEKQERKVICPPAPLDEEKAWEAALNEFESTERKKGIWAKGFSDYNGDEIKAKSYYLKIRAKQLIDSQNELIQEIKQQENRKREEEEEELRIETNKKVIGVKKIRNREYTEYDNGSCEIVTRWGDKKTFPNADALRKYIGRS